MVVKINDLANAYQNEMQKQSVFITKTQALIDCQSLLDILTSTLTKGSNISFHGIGSLVVKKRMSREATLPNGDGAHVSEAISCSMVKVIRKSQINLHSDKKTSSSSIKKALSNELSCEEKAHVLYSIFKRFLSYVRNGRYDGFFIHNFGRFSPRVNINEDALKFTPASSLKKSLQTLL